MKIIISKTPQQLGEKAAALTAQLLNKAIEEKGYAKIVLSTGASQFTTLEALINEKVDWSKVDMFHLDEYICFFVEFMYNSFIHQSSTFILLPHQH